MTKNNLDSKEGILYLEKGEFELAKKYYSNLLDSDPENSYFQFGFIISSYWDNRIERISNQSPNLELGDLLLNLREEFFQYLNEKNLKHIPELLNPLMDSVLEETMSHLLRSERDKGGNEEKITRVLFYQKKWDPFLKALHRLPTQGNVWNFYEGEALLQLGKIDSGMDSYIQAFWECPEKADFSIIQNQYLSTAVAEVLEKYPDPEKAKAFFPVYCFANQFWKSSKSKLEQDSISDWASELDSISQKRKHTHEKNRFSLGCRVLQAAFRILEFHDTRENQVWKKEAKETIQSLEL